MTYNNNVPLTGQTLGNTRASIHDNFFIIDRAFKVNHVAFSAINEGKHTIVQLPEQSTFPATPVNEGWILARDYNNITELAWRPENTLVGGDQYILTGMPVRAAGQFNITSGNGLKGNVGLAFNIQNNQVNRTSTSTVVVTFAIPQITNDYFVLSQPNNGQALTCTVKTVNGFTLTAVSGVSPSIQTLLSFVVYGG